MKQEEFKTIVLTAGEGMYLTQTEAPENIEEAMVVTTVALGRHDSPENWKEITAAESEELREAQRAAMEARLEAERAAMEAERESMMPDTPGPAPDDVPSTKPDAPSCGDEESKS